MFTLITIEQLIDLSAYSTREDIKVDTIEECYPKYFTKCTNLSNSIGKNHNYGLITLMDKFGNIIKKEIIGTWIKEQPVPPEPEPDENESIPDPETI